MLGCLKNPLDGLLLKCWLFKVIVGLFCHWINHHFLDDFLFFPDDLSKSKLTDVSPEDT